MELFDPRRHRINNRPALAGRSSIVPPLEFFPDEHGDEDSVSVRAMIPASGPGFVYRQVSRRVSLASLADIIAQYRSNPESTIETLFEVDLNAIISEPDEAELLAGLRRERKQSSESPAASRQPKPTIESILAEIKL